jgi:hypothetical protein
VPNLRVSDASGFVLQTAQFVVRGFPVVVLVEVTLGNEYMPS